MSARIDRNARIESKAMLRACFYRPAKTAVHLLRVPVQTFAHVADPGRDQVFAAGDIRAHGAVAQRGDDCLEGTQQCGSRNASRAAIPASSNVGVFSRSK